MILRRLIPAVLTLAFSTVALSADYNCEILRKKGEEQKSVKKFTLKAKAGDVTTEVAKIDGKYSAVCQLNLKDSDADAQSIVCGFANISQDIDLKVNTFSATNEVKGLEVLALAATNYGNKELVALHTTGDYQDYAFCGKSN
jgi:hypothetical protein